MTTNAKNNTMKVSRPRCFTNTSIPFVAVRRRILARAHHEICVESVGGLYKYNATSLRTFRQGDDRGRGERRDETADRRAASCSRLATNPISRKMIEKPAAEQNCTPTITARVRCQEGLIGALFFPQGHASAWHSSAERSRRIGSGESG